MAVKIKILTILFFFSIMLAYGQDKELTWKKDIQHFAHLDSVQHPAPGMILFVGSSSITKWQDIQAYFPGYKILNRGFGGTQFPDLIYFADKVIYPYKPSKIFIYEGDNDLAAGRTPEQILLDAKTLREMIAKKLPGVPVVFISLKPSVSRWKLKDKYVFVNYHLSEYCNRTALTKFADVWTPMIGPTGDPLPVFVDDNLHMTAAGYKIWQKVLKPFLD